MIFVDSGAWLASLVPTDPDYAAATTWFQQNSEPLLTTDYVVDETLTLLTVRGQKPRAIAFAAAVIAGHLATLHFIRRDDFDRAWEIFRDYLDKQWSFTDCTSMAVIERLGITTALSFDQHFRQFGTVTIVP
jgi:predicted nucleic acid-binding protein